MREALIKVRGLQFQNLISYPDIEIPLGQCTFLSGESGCGKSTLFKLMNGTLSSEQGCIEYRGQSITDWDTIELRREMILTSQEIFLFEGTIEENFRKYYEFREKECIKKENMEEYLDICSASFSLDSNCQVLSGGERQRVFTAICLSFLPKVLLLDEPTAALDEATSDRFFKQMKEFCKGQNITIVAISHNSSLVKKYADCIITLDQRLGASGIL